MYLYNSANKLVAYDSGDGTQALYVYDGQDLLLEYDETGILQCRWQHGTRIDEPLSYEAYAGTTVAGAGSVAETYADRQGSILSVVDPVTGTLLAGYESTASAS